MNNYTWHVGVLMPVSQKSGLRGLEVTCSCPSSSKETEDPLPSLSDLPDLRQQEGERGFCSAHPSLLCSLPGCPRQRFTPPPPPPRHIHTLAPHLLQSVTRQLAARAEDRTMVLGCELLQLCPELLLLLRDHSECAHLSREEPCGRSDSSTPPPTPTEPWA